MANNLYVVHCIDTEGPLYESLEATFGRISDIAGVRLQPSRDTLRKLQRGEIDLGGREEMVRLVVSEQLLQYNDTWDKVDAMLDDMMSPSYRQRYSDPQGGPWAYSWFCVDHVGYDSNPRRRDIGYHNVFDHYAARLASEPSPDELHWHVHPMPTYFEAHRNATSYLRSPHVIETVARRIIDRRWFPVAFRPGFHVERPDSHWLLEQYVPFDFGNQAMPQDRLTDSQDDVTNGRFGDWRRAVDDWSPYRPSHDDYQVSGSCRRTIFRCLNVGTRFRLIDEHEVRRAFQRAATGQPTVLAVTNHDFRDMRPDVSEVHGLVTRVAQEFPDVQWHNAGALTAARAALAIEPREPLAFNARFERRGDALLMEVESTHDIFGPQPFLAVKSHDQRYMYDNLDIQVPFRRWSYVFDEQSFRPSATETIGLGAADATGQFAVALFDSAGRPIP